jgi:ABC-type transporter Mla MlaB component
MAILSCRRKNSSFYVTFGADTSIRYAARIKSALSRIIDEPVNTFHMDLSEVEDMDITFFQLLIAFNQKLKKQNRSMTLLNLPDKSRFVTTALECGVDVHSLFEIEDG